MNSLADKQPSGKTLADVTAIRIGGHSSSSTGSRTFKWSDVYLENDDDAVVTALFGTTGGNAASPFVSIRPDEMFLVRSKAYTRSLTADQKSTVCADRR